MVASVGFPAGDAVVLAQDSAFQAKGHALGPNPFLDVFEADVVVRKITKKIGRGVETGERGIQREGDRRGRKGQGRLGLVGNFLVGGSGRMHSASTIRGWCGIRGSRGFRNMSLNFCQKSPGDEVLAATKALQS